MTMNGADLIMAAHEPVAASVGAVAFVPSSPDGGSRLQGQRRPSKLGLGSVWAGCRHPFGT